MNKVLPLNQTLPGIVFVVGLGLAVLACGSQVPEVRTATTDNGANQGANSAQEFSPPVEPANRPGSMRSQPAPFGSVVQLGEITLKVEEVLRPADGIIAEGSIFNPTPEAGEEYDLVKIAAACEKSSDESCSVFGIEFKLVGSSGVAHPVRPFLGGVEDLYEGGEFFGGSTKNGFLPFRVPQDESDMVLKYEKIFLGEVYLSIER